jgi:HlyD family secretion protein
MTLGDVVREVHATGRLEAVTTVAVGAEISGRIASVEVDYNDRVKAGQVLARFDRAALEAQVAQAQATRAAARATLAQAKIERAQAERNRERARQLRVNQLIAEAEEETAISNAWLAAQRAEAAEAQVLAQDAAFNLVRTNRDHALIRSPIDGVIITRNIDPGQTVASALATPVLFSVAANLERMEVVAAVDEADIGQVAKGQKAAFGVNAYPDRVFEGELTEVRNSPVIVQDVVTYGCVVSVDNSELSLKPGMTASVRIRTAQVSGVARVPSAALHFSMPSEAPADGQSVWILDAGIDAGALAEGAQVIVDLTPQGRKAYGVQQ